MEIIKSISFPPIKIIPTKFFKIRNFCTITEDTKEFEFSNKENRELFFSNKDFKLFDCHCHPTDDMNNIHLLKEFKVTKLAMMGTSPKDWDKIITVAHKNKSKTIFGLGIHPWFAHLYVENDSWKDLLIQKIKESDPHFLGEIGLDKVAKTPQTNKNEFEHQKKIFIAQLKLAAELSKPVSLHGVRCVGTIHDVIKDLPIGDIPPKIMLHSYGGSVESIKLFLRMKGIGDRFYFSFSSVINMKFKNVNEIIDSVPTDRLLLESDLDSLSHMEKSLFAICEFVAHVKGWSLLETSKITFKNSLEFFGVDD
eukprot:TRINITY_DN1396_c0_g2_i1.p1 TRINITY_DN1396_c0_g2~~TRINITY_DN1396_c0_g2_i1.p1  ORF type:complete len:309 (+),score=78.97 TRINITY_DN1396_c0_g2_i1:46-972(+)